MVRRNLSLPHELAVVTDIPEGLDPSLRIIRPPGDFLEVEIPTWNGPLPNCFRRLSLFRRDAAEVFGGSRIVSMDTDCVIADSLDPLLSREEDLIMYRGTNHRRPYNGSMIMLTAGCRPKVFEKFTPLGAIEAGRQFVGSDQAWISHILGWHEATWGPEDGIAWFGSQFNTGETRIMFFPGHTKPWDLLLVDQWVSEHYRGEEGGRAIILGAGPSLWEDVQKAVREPFDAVIAYPESAAHWSGPIREIVADRREADIVIRAHGFREAVMCGAEV
jgi:hypothetical protein